MSIYSPPSPKTLPYWGKSPLYEREGLGEGLGGL